MRSFLAWFDAVDFFHLPIWAMAILRIAFIVFFWILITRLVSKALKTIVAHYCVEEIKGSERLKRIETIQRVVLYILRAALAFLAVSLVLNEIGISIVPILGAAGVAGIAIGLAAQNLLKDYLNGLFLLLENQIRQGDVISVVGKTGSVEEMTLRYVRLRDDEGDVHFIPNGSITTVTSKTRSFAFALIDVHVDHETNLEHALELMRQVAQTMVQESLWADKVKGEPEVVGVQSWTETSIILRCRFKVIPHTQGRVRREYLFRLKQSFQQQGISIANRSDHR